MTMTELQVTPEQSTMSNIERLSFKLAEMNGVEMSLFELGLSDGKLVAIEQPETDSADLVDNRMISDIPSTNHGNETVLGRDTNYLVGYTAGILVVRTVQKAEK